MPQQQIAGARPTPGGGDGGVVVESRIDEQRCDVGEVANGIKSVESAGADDGVGDSSVSVRDCPLATSS